MATTKRTCTASGEKCCDIRKLALRSAMELWFDAKEWGVEGDEVVAGVIEDAKVIEAYLMGDA